MTGVLQTLQEQHNAILAPMGNKQIAMGYGDFAGELAAIEQGLGILTMEPSEVLLVRGPDASKFLHGLTTNDINGLKPGEAAHQLICTTKGKITHHVITVRLREDSLAVICEPGESGTVASHLEHYHIREEVEIGHVELVRVDLLGPAAPDALRALGLETGSVEGKLEGAPVLTPRLSSGSLERVMVLASPTAVSSLVEGLLEGQGSGVTPRLVGWEASEEARIWAGIPRYPVDYAKDFFPAEAALYDHISYEKGCYIGQETHARMHYRGHPNRKLVAVEIPETAAAGLEAGGELFHEGASVGALTCLAREARSGQRRGIALVRYELVKAPGVVFSLSEANIPQVQWKPLATDLGAKQPTTRV